MTQVDTLISNTLVGNLISTLEIECLIEKSLIERSIYADKAQKNTIYDELVLLIQRTPSITSVKISTELQSILIDAIRNTCGTGHWEHLRVVEIMCPYSKNNTIYKGLKDFKNSIEKINAASSSNGRLVFGIQL